MECHRCITVRASCAGLMPVAAHPGTEPYGMGLLVGRELELYTGDARGLDSRFPTGFGAGLSLQGQGYGIRSRAHQDAVVPCRATGDAPKLSYHLGDAYP